MGKATFAVVLVLLCFAMFALPMVYADASGGSTTEIDEWVHKVINAKEKVSKLHFYVHDYATGPNTSAVTAAKAVKTTPGKSSPTLLGMVKLIDDPLTEGPELTSNQVGRAQGFYDISGGTDQSERHLQGASLVMAVHLVFTEGQFKDSSLAVFGRVRPIYLIHEIPIVGGTGIFRLARGVILSRLHSLNVTSNNAIIEYNVVAIHY